MENKEWFQFPTGVQNIVAIFNWIKSELVRNANKLWEVTVSPGLGTGTVRDSKNKVTIDLTNVVLGVVTANSGTGDTILKDVTIANKKSVVTAKTISEGANITITDTGDELQISASGEFSGVVIATENIGSGEGVLIVPPTFAVDTWTIQGKSTNVVPPLLISSDGTTITISLDMVTNVINTCEGPITVYSPAS